MKSLRIFIFIFFAAFCTLGGQAKKEKGRLADRIGVCTSLSNAPIVKSAGGHHVEQSITGFMIPEKSDEEFSAKLQEAMKPLITMSQRIQ